jgi:hypothetical protein
MLDAGFPGVPMWAWSSAVVAAAAMCSEWEQLVASSISDVAATASRTALQRHMRPSRRLARPKSAQPIRHRRWRARPTQ